MPSSLPSGADLAAHYAEALEWQLATMEMLAMRKKPDAHEWVRQRAIVTDMMRVYENLVVRPIEGGRLEACINMKLQGGTVEGIDIWLRQLRWDTFGKDCWMPKWKGWWVQHWPARDAKIEEEIRRAEMADHEIPFTRTDMLQLLAGNQPKMTMEYFMDAVAGQAKSHETLTGDASPPEHLFNRMVGDEACYFNVPYYFYEAWGQACDEVTIHAAKFHGITLVSWRREFIVAHLEFSKPGTWTTDAS